MLSRFNFIISAFTRLSANLIIMQTEIQRNAVNSTLIKVIYTTEPFKVFRLITQFIGRQQGLVHSRDTKKAISVEQHDLNRDTPSSKMFA
jgi:hypothetical protein